MAFGEAPRRVSTPCFVPDTAPRGGTSSQSSQTHPARRRRQDTAATSAAPASRCLLPGGAEHDIGLAVLERLLRGAVAALWHLIGGEDLREDHQLRDVALGDRRDPLDDGAVRASEAEGVDLDDVADDIPRRIRQRCHRRAAAVSGTLLARGRGGAREHTRAGAGSAARQRQQRRHGKSIPQNADSTPHPVGQLTCLVHG